MGRGSDIGEEGRDEIDAKQSGGEYSVGDVIWLKIRGGIWWPGKIVGEKNASSGGKFKIKANGEVRVRVYGSYEYLYVDPVKTSAEFETILKRNNGNYKQIFEKSLKQSISSSRCDGLKGQQTIRRESRKIRDSKKQGKHNEINPSDPGTKQEAVVSGSSPQSSARRMRVMKSLGLCAPAGSPFAKK